MAWKGGEKRQVVDFRLVNGKVIVKGKINGGRAIDFALDTAPSTRP